MAVLAANGVAEVEVARVPSIAIIATGDELADVDQPLAEGQIRRSNDRALAAALEARGFDDVELTRVPDDLEATRAAPGRAAGHASRCWCCPAASRWDSAISCPRRCVRSAWKRCCTGIAQRPGKPMWFGIGPQGQVVFALPGNPVSALVCAVRYMLPALERAMGWRRAPPERVVLAAEAVHASRLDLLCTRAGAS